MVTNLDLEKAVESSIAAMQRLCSEMQVFKAAFELFAQRIEPLLLPSPMPTPLFPTAPQFPSSPSSSSLPFSPPANHTVAASSAESNQTVVPLRPFSLLCRCLPCLCHRPTLPLQILSPPLKSTCFHPAPIICPHNPSLCPYYSWPLFHRRRPNPCPFGSNVFLQSIPYNLFGSSHGFATMG